MKPGDIIEWVYKQTDKLVAEDEELWSTPMSRWVPIGSSLVHTLISINDERISWLNEKGLFHARVDDATFVNERVLVVPRSFVSRNVNL